MTWLYHTLCDYETWWTASRSCGGVSFQTAAVERDRWRAPQLVEWVRGYFHTRQEDQYFFF